MDSNTRNLQLKEQLNSQWMKVLFPRIIKWQKLRRNFIYKCKIKFFQFPEIRNFIYFVIWISVVMSVRRVFTCLRASSMMRPVQTRIPTRYWQEVKKGDEIYYVDTDTFEKTTEKPNEYVPHDAMESRLVR